jgi:5-methylthioribose kinase
MPAVVPDSLDSVLGVLRAAGRLGDASSVRPLPGGVSSIIAVLDEDTAPRVVKAARRRLDVPQHWTADPRRALREGICLAALDGAIGPVRVPRLYHVHPDPPILELEWFGPPAANWKAELLGGLVDGDVVAALAAGMTALHRAAIPAQLDGPAGVRLFEKLRLAPYYRAVAAAQPRYAPALLALIDDCLAVRPRYLVHGDFTPKNVLVTRAAPVLLDWEVVHAGDPAFDLGMLTAHLLLKASRHPGLPASPLLAAASQLAASYSGPADPGRAVRHAGAIMLARLWGKSTVEYLASAAQRATAAAIGERALVGAYPSLDALLAELGQEET